ncbi:hypothetical protein S101395_02714 [Bacillus sonorensis]|uniref:Transcriptional regulator n=2 Tax=Bacillus sonorensis TaxID=119858 RepID=M5PBN6_9BACI|nr:hypothetical protein S101395_02714 [Bacillus sonorensis]EME72177.1 transcriptional regulator [Bacillus sonorensis L12]TWK84164.1 hypothetical protein CHCC20335_4232 [Bacillus paralicheniformis]GIN68436.1 hypothetical protein J41TS2_38570 [Bacillus sonorensis]
MITIFSILEILVNGLMIFDVENVSKRLEDFDKMSSQFYSFIEDEKD